MSAPTYETLLREGPVIDCPTPEQAAATISRDAFLSFRLSQGEVGTQRYLFALTASVYARHWSPDGFRTVLPEAINQADERVRQIRPPAIHKDIPVEKIRPEAEKQWRNL